MEYATRFGSLDDYEKGGIDLIDDDPKRYAFSNIEDRGRYFAFKNAENQPVCSIAPLIQIKERRLSGISGLDKMRPQKRDGISQGPRKPR